MNRLMSSVLLALAFTVTVPGPAQAAPQSARAYAPENLRTLSRDDQTRVISLEYAEQARGRRIPDEQLRFYLDQVNRSNWTFNQIKRDIAQSLGGNSGGDDFNRYPPFDNGSTIRCDSNGNKTARCSTPWRGQSRLVRQVSTSACVEGRSWSSDNGLITVWSGCRGEFEPEAQGRPPFGGGDNDSIRCESDGNRERSCRTPWRGGSRLSRQLSKAACVQGETWHSQNGQITVNNGCRGEFVAGRYQSRSPRNNPGTNRGNGYNVICESTAKNPQSCAWDNRRGSPYVERQISTTRCTENGTWWYDGNAIWVKNGCRAVFGAR